MSSAVGVYDPGFADHNDDGFNIVWVFVAVIAVLVGLLLLLVRVNSHAVERHPVDAQRAVDCYNSGKTVRQMTNQSNGRLANICQIDERLFAVVVLSEDGKLVTAFVKNKLRRLDQVINYLTNTGYVP